MRAVLCERHGGPEELTVTDIDSPELQPGQVRIRVRACGVNFPDVLMIAGRYQIQPELPFVPGAEFAGDIVEIAAGVKGLHPGQRVLAMCGHGAMAEEACVAAHTVVPIPDAMDYITAAGFLLTYGTSWHALKQRAGLSAGETLLVLGAAGGVGLAAVELGTVVGSTVIAAASSAAKLELAARHGATRFIDYGRENLRERVREITGGRGADVIYDPVGGDLFDHCLRSIAWKGRILVVGFAGGDIQKIPANLPLLKGCSIVGVFWGRFAELEPEAQALNTRELLELYAQGRLKPHISHVFPLSQAADALRQLLERRAMGKLVVEIQPASSFGITSN
jgi:NADPH2:quinone reductase